VQLAKDAKERKSTITLPPKVFSLSPTMVNKAEQTGPQRARTFAEVEGDFLAYDKSSATSIRVSTRQRPARRQLPLTFQGAGCCSTRNDNFVRLERA